jgi:ribonuclease Z
MLDAGAQNFSNPEHIFITHGHGDHTAELPHTMIAETGQKYVFSLYGPRRSEGFVSGYIRSFFELNSMKTGAPIPGFRYRELDAGSELDFTANTFRLRVKAIDCDHSVPTISYLFSKYTDKLKESYRGRSGKELAQLRKSGTAIMDTVCQPLFAFVCDTSIKTVAKYEDTLSQYPYVIIECTFLYPDELERARQTRHIHWSQLRPYVVAHPSVTFVLIHFSLRYRDEEIDEFFAGEQVSNAVPWTESVNARGQI